MKKVTVITDSNSGITQGQAKELGIRVVPMPFFVNEETYLEDISMNQQELSEALEVSRQTIGSLENGRYNPSIILAFKIARYFDMLIEDIFIYEPKEDRKEIRK